MSPLAPLALFGFLPLVFYFFNRFPPVRAVVVSFVAGYLFLPQPGFSAKYPIVQGLPPYEKMSAICYCVLLAAILLDSGRFSSFKLGWLDLPMLIWCLVPLATQISNGLSPISPVTGQIMTWGVPYFLGRIYFNDLAALRQLAVGIFAGGVAYMPLCLLEMRISPTLHMKLYGYHARVDFSQTIRYGGYRPTVLLEHGLWVGMWMMVATLLGLLLWRTGVIKQLWGISMNQLAPALLVTFVLVKSTGAYLYLVMGVGIFLVGKWLRISLPALLLVVALSSYLYLGATGNLYTIPEVRAFLVKANEDPSDRSQSLAFRIANEEILSEKARGKMLLGWGDSGGNRVYDETGKDISVTDSIWIIVFGFHGVVGLISWTASLVAPSVAFFFLRYPASTWFNRKVAPAAGLAIILILYLVDSVLNAMFCPVFILANGGISGLVMKEPETNKATSDRSSVSRRSMVQQRQNQAS
jgi:hypothetical protein